MISQHDAQLHAIACGCEGIAYPISANVAVNSPGWLSADVINLETMEIIYPSGFYLYSEDMVDLFLGYGIDYVVLEK